MYSRLATNYSLPLIYAASGNATSIDLFAASTAPTPVVTKFSLLSGEDLALLESMSWDQQALVDYIILARSSRFLGVRDSSFSYNLAIARQAFGRGTCGGEETVTALAQGVVYQDDMSVLIGKADNPDFRHGLWP